MARDPADDPVARRGLQAADERRVAAGGVAPTTVSCRSSGTKSPIDEQGSTCLSIIQLSAPTSARLASPPSARARLLTPSTSSDTFGSLAAASPATAPAPSRARAIARRRPPGPPGASAFPPASAARAPRRRRRRSPGRTSCRGAPGGSRSPPRSSSASDTDDRTSARRSSRPPRGCARRSGMSVPRSPSGYPVPSQFSWWCRTIGTTGYGKVDRGEDLGADRRVQLHLLELGRRQLARLVEDVLGHGDLAGVVQQRAGLDGLQRLLVGDAELARQSRPRPPARAGCGRASLRPWHRSPSPAFRPSTDTCGSASRRDAFESSSRPNDDRIVRYEMRRSGRISAMALKCTCRSATTSRSATDAPAAYVGASGMKCSRQTSNGGRRDFGRDDRRRQSRC